MTESKLIHAFDIFLHDIRRNPDQIWIKILVPEDMSPEMVQEKISFYRWVGGYSIELPHDLTPEEITGRYSKEPIIKFEYTPKP